MCGSPHDYALLHILYVCVHACMQTQSCPTLCDPTDSLPVSSVHGIFQARVLMLCYAMLCYAMLCYAMLSHFSHV